MLSSDLILVDLMGMFELETAVSCKYHLLIYFLKVYKESPSLKGIVIGIPAARPYGQNTRYKELSLTLIMPHSTNLSFVLMYTPIVDMIDQIWLWSELSTP